MIDIVKRIEKKINFYLKGENNKKLLLMISGGLDSTVLFDILLNLHKRKKIQLSLFHCNYNVNENADAAEELCRKLSIANNVKLIVNKNKISKNNFEHKARIFRYSIAKKISKNDNISIILTAHHFDDQIETLYMKYITKADWLSSLGIREKFNKIYRPMLEIKKKYLADYAKVNNIIWIEDKSNNDINFLRNKVRHKIIPLIKEKSPSDLLKLINQFDLNNTEYLKLKNKIIDSQSYYINKMHSQFIEVNNFIFNQVNPRELKLYYQIYSKIALDIYITGSKKHWNNFFKFMKYSKTGKYFKFNGEISILKDKNCHILYKNDYLRKRFEKIKIEDKSILWYDTEIVIDNKKNENNKIKYNLVVTKKMLESGLFVRSWKDGDKCFSNYYHNYINVSDIFINNKVSNFNKNQYPIVVDTSDEIISIPNLYNKIPKSLIENKDAEEILWILNYE